jgi:hypothetical protein
MKKLLVAILCFILMMSVAVVCVKANSVLTLTAIPSSQNYNKYSTVCLNGTVDYYDFYSHSPASDALVGIEVDDSNGAPVLTRTIQPGSSLAQPWNTTAYIDQAYLSDQSGHLLTSVPLPTANNDVVANYTVDIHNNGGTAIQSPAVAVLTVFDSNGIPVAMDTASLSIGPYGDDSYTRNFNINSNAHYGAAYAFVDVFSNWPSKGGIALGPEATFNFTITGGSPFVGTAPTTYAFGGFYNFTFTLAHDAPTGLYNVYMTAIYHGGQNADGSSMPNIYGGASTNFVVALVGDLNGDGVVNFRDITIFVSDYIAYYQYGTYTAAIDFNHDGVINFRDLTLFVQYYLIYWSA